MQRKARDAEKSVSGAASTTGETLAKVASKAKVPALATAAAAAGVAGGMLIAQRKAKPKISGRMPSASTMESAGKGLLKATENVGKASERVGELSAEVRRVREGMQADSRRRSPIEVVLDGLTHRSS